MAYTPETYWERVQEVNVHASHIIPVSTYTNIKEPITCKCTICNYVWTTKAESFIGKKSGCPNCRGSKPITPDNYQERIKENNKHFDSFIFMTPYTKRKYPLQIKCKICGNEWITKIRNLMIGHGCPKCANNQKPAHEEFVEQVNSINSNIIILEQYVNHNTHLLCKCKQCDYQWKSSPANILQGSRCPVCTNKKVIKEINSIYALRPDLIKYFKHKEDSYKYSLGSEQFVSTKCPLCGYEKRMKVENLTHKGFSCNRCGDNISYPNKYCRAFLSQLPISNFITEFTPQWANGRAYDNYFEYNGQKYILEADGDFHYYDNPISGQSAKESQYIDRLKEEMANEHNITVIRIDCRESKSEYISQNIIRSILSDIFDLSQLDWNKCDEIASGNIYKMICDDFNNSELVSTDLAKKYKLSLVTINRILRKGVELKWCDEEIVKERSILCRRKCIKRKISVGLFDNDGNCVKRYYSIADCVRDLTVTLDNTITIYKVRQSIYNDVKINGYKICRV